MSRPVTQIARIRDLLLAAHWKREDEDLARQIGQAVTGLEGTINQLADAAELAQGASFCLRSPCRASVCVACRVDEALRLIGRLPL